MFHSLDFVIDAFEFADGDAVIVAGKYAFTVASEGVSDAYDRFQA